MAEKTMLTVGRHWQTATHYSRHNRSEAPVFGFYTRAWGDWE